MAFLLLGRTGLMLSALNCFPYWLFSIHMPRALMVCPVCGCAQWPTTVEVFPLLSSIFKMQKPSSGDW